MFSVASRSYCALTMTATLESLPKLCSVGVELARDEQAFGFLQSSVDYLDDPSALRDRLTDLGYLYLPGFFDREEVLAARMVILEELAARGAIDPRFPLEEGVHQPGGKRIPIDGNGLASKPALDHLLRGPQLLGFFEQLLGGDVRGFDFTWFRNTTRGQSAHPHCDIVYMGRGTRDLYTCWLPYGDVPLELGGLMVLEDSHRKSERLRNYLQRDVDVYCTNRPAELEAFEQEDHVFLNQHHPGWLTKNAATLRQHLGGRWLSANYAAGDIMIFGMHLVHGSLDNQTDRFRLSTDTRYQLASEPVDERWIGEQPVGHSMAGKQGRIC